MYYNTTLQVYDSNLYHCNLNSEIISFMNTDSVAIVGDCTLAVTEQYSILLSSSNNAKCAVSYEVHIGLWI